jgi:hypothetical protein
MVGVSEAHCQLTIFLNHAIAYGRGNTIYNCFRIRADKRSTVCREITESYCLRIVLVRVRESVNKGKNHQYEVPANSAREFKKILRVPVVV